MDLHHALRTRRTIHTFRRDPVPLDAVRRALECATLAPNHKLTEPWRFTLLGRAAREPLAELAVTRRVEQDGTPPPAEQLARLRAKFLDPPLALLLHRIPSDDPVRDAEDRAAMGCAAQNLFLSLHADGLGSKWSSGAIIRDPRFREVLALPEDGTVIDGIIWVGHPAVVPEAKPRTAWRELCTERLDAPAERTPRPA
jgi:nitroreductase